MCSGGGSNADSKLSVLFITRIALSGLPSLGCCSILCSRNVQNALEWNALFLSLSLSDDDGYGVVK